MQTTTGTKIRDIITPVDGKRTDFIAATRLANVLGGLPSNVLVDRIARSGEKPVEGPFWTSHLLVYPGRDGIFVNEDFVDWQTKWLLPAAYIPSDIMGVKGMGLLIQPHIIEKEHSRTVVHALMEGVRVIQPFLPESGWGKACTSTGMPLENVDSEKWVATGDARYLWRVDGPAIRPIVRDFNTPYDIIAGCTPDRAFAVSYATTTRERGESIPTTEGSFVVLRNRVGERDIQPRELAQLTYACQQELELLSGMVEFTLPAMNELVGRLRFVDNRLAIRNIAPDAARELLAAARKEYLMLQVRLTGITSATAISLLIGSSELE